jgi:hypothetical protein
MIYSLNQTDKDFLYRKYIKLGMTPKESYENIKQLSNHLKITMEKLKIKKLTESEMQDKFKQEFEKICMRLDK